MSFEETNSGATGNKMSYELAEKEVVAWLTKMGIRERKRAANKESVSELIESVMEGSIVFEDNMPKYTLADPPTGTSGSLFTDLHFSKRYTVQDIQARTKASGATDEIGRILATISLATGIGTTSLSKMGTQDFAAVTHIIVFF